MHVNSKANRDHPHVLVMWRYYITWQFAHNVLTMLLNVGKGAASSQLFNLKKQVIVTPNLIPTSTHSTQDSSQ